MTHPIIDAGSAARTASAPATGRPSPYAPGTIGSLRLRNRTIKTATYEGMSPGGLPSPALTEHHRAIAAGGIGMTTVAYCAVHATGRTFAEQLVMDDAAIPALKNLTNAVHAEGAAVSLQLAHAGGFSKDRANKLTTPRGPAGPSRTINRYGMLSGLIWVREMTEADLNAVVEQFATAATKAKAADFDAIELHLGHGYLLSQFLSPAFNHRKDDYGGSLQNRLRLPLRVLQAVRQAVGPSFPILVKMNLRDHLRGGLEIDDAIQIARALEDASTDALVLSGGIVSHSAFYLLRGERPLKEMIEVEKSFAQRWALRLFGRMVIERLPFEELFFLDLAKQVRAAVQLPLVLLGGAISGENLQTAMDAGFDFVAIGRALIENPNFVVDVAAGNLERSPCDHCNQCVAEMDRRKADGSVGGVRCILPDAQRSPGHAARPVDPTDRAQSPPASTDALS